MSTIVKNITKPQVSKTVIGRVVRINDSENCVVKDDAGNEYVVVTSIKVSLNSTVRVENGRIMNLVGSTSAPTIFKV